MNLTTTPTEWLDQRGIRCTDGCARCVTVADLIAADGSLVRELIASVADRRGLPARAAALHLAAWYGGGLAGVVADIAARADAGMLVSAAAAHWRLHPEGWPERIGIVDPRFVVAADHPWAHDGRSEVVADRDAREAGVVRALVATCEPVIEQLHRSAVIGRAGLWNQVADGLLLRLEQTLPDGQTERAARLLGATDAPWRATPERWRVELGSGDVVVVRKGGCCLADTGRSGRRCDSCSMHSREVCTWLQTRHDPDG